MKTMKVKVHIDRAQAIRTGSAQYGDIVVDLDPAPLTAEQREVLAGLAEDTSGVTSLTGRVYSHADGMPPRPRLSAPDPVAWIDWHIASRAAAKTIAEAKLAQVQASADRYVDWASTRPLDEWIGHTLGGEYEAKYPRSNVVGIEQ